MMIPSLYWLLAGVACIVAGAEGRLQCPETGSLRFRGDGTGLAEVYDQLTTCPDITDLSLKLTMTGCVLTFDPWRFRFQRGDRFPPLKNLTISRYDFEGESTIRIPHRYHHDTFLRKAQKYLSVFKSLPPAPNLEHWLHAMDFTRLERLRMTDNMYFWKRMQDELPRLRHLSTTVREFEGEHMGALLEFLKHLRPLESLHIFNENPLVDSKDTLDCTHFPLEPIFAHHGPSLKNLTLIQRESSIAGYRRLACAPAQIAQIYEACPSLTHLGLDVDRHSYQWPNATFDALVANPHITSLHLRFEIGKSLNDEFGFWGFDADIEKDSRYLKPRINQRVAARLFDDLQAKKQGEVLERLEVELADYPEDSYRGPMRAEPWVEGREGKWICTKNADGATECITPRIPRPWE